MRRKRWKQFLTFMLCFVVTIGLFPIHTLSAEINSESQIIEEQETGAVNLEISEEESKSDNATIEIVEDVEESDASLLEGDSNLVQESTSEEKQNKESSQLTKDEEDISKEQQNILEETQEDVSEEQQNLSEEEQNILEEEQNVLQQQNTEEEVSPINEEIEGVLEDEEKIEENTDTIASVNLNNPRIVEDDSMESGKKVIWDCIWFGSYPQSEVLSSDPEYNKLQTATSWDKNNDIILENNRYHRIRKGDATYIEEQEENSDYYWSDSTTYHYFKYEPIKWRILNISGSHALLLSDIVLDNQKYNLNSAHITWEVSSIRSWLNGYGASVNEPNQDYTGKGFIDQAFSKKESAAIKLSKVKNNVILDEGTNGGNNTEDKIFLLAKSDLFYTDEAISYGFNSKDTVGSKSSVFAKAMGASRVDMREWEEDEEEGEEEQEEAKHFSWWLRSCGSMGNYEARYISARGKLKDGSVSDCRHAIRPALELNLADDNLYSYAGTVDSSEMEQTGPTDNNESCGKNLKWSLDEQGVLTITGTGDMYNFSDYSEQPWDDNRDKIVEVKIEEGVTRIGDSAFDSCEQLEKITIANSVKTIGDMSFLGCTSLKEIMIPDGVTEIGGYAFSSTGLTKIQIPNTVQRVGQIAFADCQQLEEVVLSENLSSIGRNMFAGCVELKHIVIPDNIRSIGARAFGYCTKLAEIVIPDSVNYIGEEAFVECESLKSVQILNKYCVIFNKDTTLDGVSIIYGYNGSTAEEYAKNYKKTFQTLGEYQGQQQEGSLVNQGFCGENVKWEFYSNGLLYISGNGEMNDYDRPEMGYTKPAPWDECGYSEMIKEIKIDSGVTVIGRDAFNSCYYVTKVSIAEGVKKIRAYAFNYCKELTEIVLPQSLEIMETTIFMGCTKLKSISIPKGVNKIEEGAFEYCDNFDSIQILNKDCEIGDSEYTIHERTVIYGYTGSTAQAYAKKYKRTFKALDASASTYMISYNANGGKNAPAAQTKKKGKTLILSKTKPTRKGYTFLGWATSKSSTKISYKSGASFKSDKNTTLYAVWQANAYKVAFNKNGGTGSMSTISCVYDKTFALKANAFKRKGYTFKGWNTKADGTGTYSYADKEKVKNVSSVAGKTLTLYAQWEPNAYKVAFDKNGGTGSMSTVSCVYDKTFTLKANTFKKKGYTFKGWNTKADGTGTYSYADKAKVKNISSVAGKTIKLFAQWEPNAYKVAFDKNGGTGSMSTVSCVYDKVFTLKANAFKRKGYTFKGWNTKADGTGTYSYADKAKVKNVSSVAGKTMKLFAQWEPNKYILRYDGNGATSGSMEDTKDCQYDKNYILRENAFEREGYTFIGWAKSEKGALRYKDAEEVNNISSVDGKIVVLYAVWEKNE